ncbi:MAG TPA: 8-amino-7-oxononanoate synthase [Phycisphaerae bacterium]|nr:8-amino-7-oxononanoate synthase [Phycisphaerae bacterium]
MPDPDFIRDTLSRLKAKGLHRRLVALGSAAGRRHGEAGLCPGGAGPHVEIAGRWVLQFASNNYLGLANDPRVKEAARKGIERWGWGAGASRLVSGHTEAHAALEADLAAFKHTEAALVFPTGYMTNLGVVTALAGRGDTVVMDRANHASLYDAVRLSGARLVRYPQADAGAAARLLEEHRGGTGRRLLVTDTVFSMDGRCAPLAELADLCRSGNCMLVLDEAHAIGVLGPTGAGLAEELGVTEGITASVGTLSKALGGIGGFVAASRDVCDLIVNRARPFIYTTALPAAACEAARAALQIVRAEPERRRRLLALARRLRTRLREEGFDVGAKKEQKRGHSTFSAGTQPSHREPQGQKAECPLFSLFSTPIIPIILGDPERALAFAAALLEEGIFCPAIRPPTVPPGTSRLRVSVTAEHTDDDVERLLSALVRIRC